MTMRFMMALAAVYLACTMPAQAGDAPVPAPSATAAPLEISADKGLVWDRANRSYTAKGRAEVRQGDMVVTADQITARYAEESNTSDIQSVTAEGNVTLSQAPYTAYGDRADYDVTTGRAILVGEDLRIITPAERLTARDRITYHAVEGRMTAEGDAVMQRGTDSLSAATLNATFKADTAGRRALDAVTAEGGVSIKTPRETITGNRGVYRGATQQAELTGQVVIEQGKNRLEGRRATVDMKTGLSQLYGAGGGDGRVRGVFYPKDAKVTPAPAVVPVSAPAAAPAPVSAPVTPTAPVTPPPAPEKPPAPVQAEEPPAPAPVVEAPAPAPAPEPIAEEPIVEEPAEPVPDEPFAVPTVETTP